MSTLPRRPPGAKSIDSPAAPPTTAAAASSRRAPSAPRAASRAPRRSRASQGSGRSSATRRRTLREQVLELGEGLCCLGDADLLAMVLGSSKRGGPGAAIARGILESVGGLEGIAKLGPTVLANEPGLGLAGAVRLAAAQEIGRRTVARLARPREALRGPGAVAAWFVWRIGLLEHEEMWVLSLDGRQGLCGAKRVAQGGLHGCAVAARDILRAALAHGASSMVLIHNHPSGDPTPSAEDIAMTRVVAAAAEVVGTPLADHVIVTAAGEYVSLLELGVLAAS